MALRIGDVAPDFTAETTPVSDEAARQRFPSGWRAPKPYMRFVAQPQG